MAIKLMMDSASSMTKEEANKIGAYLVPVTVRFGKDEYMDGEDLLPNEFYEKLTSCSELPQTSQVNPFKWEEEFDKALKECDELVVVTLSSGISNTYENARVIAENEKYKGKIRVVDSMSACLGEKILGLYALELIDKGLNLDEIVEKLEQAKSKIKVMAVVNTLKYLKKGGRIGLVTAIAGELLGIKPVAGMVNGKVGMLGKTLGNKKANAFMNSIIERSNGIDFSMPHGVMYSGNDDKLLKAYLEESKNIWQEENTPIYIMGSTIGTHVGPGAVGVAFFEK